VEPALLGAIDGKIATLRRAGARPEVDLVLSLGGSDCIAESMNPSWRDHDFHLPELPDLTDRRRHCIPLALVQEWVADDLRPIARALRLFQERADATLSLLIQPPPHRSDEACRSHLAGRGIDVFIAPFAIRAKLAWLYRRELQVLCAGAGIAAIDPWPALEEDHALMAPFELDGFHIAPSGVAAVVPLILASSRGVAPGQVQVVSRAAGAIHDPRITDAPGVLAGGKGRVAGLIGQGGARMLGNLLAAIARRRASGR